MKAASHCQWTGSGVTAFVEDDKGVVRRIPLADARAGMVFPTGSLPGYYVLLGRKWDILPSGKRPLIFLAEGEDIMHETLFGQFTDDCTKYKCRTVYAYLPRKDRAGGVGGYDDLWRYLRNRKLGINLIPAPAAEDVEYGKALAREFWTDGAIDLPPTDLQQTILVSQLHGMQGIEEVGRDNSHDDADLYAFHAFRYLLCGFVKFNNVIPYEARAERDPRANPKGWT